MSIPRSWGERPYAMLDSERERNQKCQREHRGHWAVIVRKANYSAFNGYHRTPSAYSLVGCFKAGCGRRFRTRAKYVDKLPDAD